MILLDIRELLIFIQAGLIRFEPRYGASLLPPPGAGEWIYVKVLPAVLPVFLRPQDDPMPVKKDCRTWTGPAMEA